MELLLAELLLDVGPDPFEAVVVMGPLVDKDPGTANDGGFDCLWSEAFKEAAAGPKWLKQRSKIMCLR